MPYIGRAATNTGNVRYLDDIASGFDGSDTTFTAQVGGVSITPDQESVKIFLDGVFQHPGSGNAYTISGSTITFTAAPVANTVFSAYVVGAGAYLDDNAVSSAKLDDDAVTAAKLDDDGTGFQVGDLGVGGSLTSGDKLTVTGRLRASGGIVGDLTGNVTGNVSGTAAAGTLTGNTLASTVTASSLTSVGTIGTGVWQGTAVASAYLDADTAHLSTTQTFSGAKTFGDNLTIANNKQILGAADGVAYSFTGDTDTGIQSGGTNTIQITTAGSKAMDFDGNQLATFTGNIQTTKGIRAGTYSANNAFSENGIDNLQVHYARFGGHSNAVADILYNAYWTGSAWINDNDSNNSYLLRLLNGSGLTFQVSDAGATPSFATKFSVTNTGNATFAGLVTIQGAGIDLANGAAISSQDSGSGSIKLFGGGTNKGGYIDLRGGGNSGDMRVYTGTSGDGTLALTINSSQNATFYGGNIYLDGNSNAFVYIDSSGTGLASWVVHRQGGNDKWYTGVEQNAGNQYRIYDPSDGSVAVNLVAGGSSWVANSDERMKKDIVPMENRLDDLLKIKVRRFKWKHSDKEDFGFVAQELETCAPDAVEVGSDEVYSKEEAEDSPTAVEGALKNPYGVSREQLIPMMVKAIQELSAEVEKLKGN